MVSALEMLYDERREDIQEISLIDWTSNSSMQILAKEFQVGDGTCNIKVRNKDTDDYIIISGIYQPGFSPMYGTPKTTMPTVYFRCMDANGDALSIDHPARRLMRHLAHQTLDVLYGRNKY